MKQLFIILLAATTMMFAANDFESDTFSTSKGDLKITFIGHGTLMMEFDGKVIHIDPWTRLADYTTLPKADIILITHEHGDHLDANAIDQASKESTKILLTQICYDKLGKGTVINNGDTKELLGLTINAVPAYNIVNMRGEGNPYHPKGNGNGYVISFGDKRVYVAGDTENIPEMTNLGKIDIAFVPMNLPYTMTPEMAADAARKIKPAVLYPYHFGETDTNQLLELFKDNQNIDIRIRKLQ